MSARWLTQEIQTLQNLLVDGVAISTIQNSIHKTEGAISKKAYAQGYSTQGYTGAKTLHKGITRRYTALIDDDSNIANSEMDEILNSAVNAILRDEGIIDVNNLVIEILRDSGVTITPEIICSLSNHILDSRGAYNAA